MSNYFDLYNVKNKCPPLLDEYYVMIAYAENTKYKDYRVLKIKDKDLSNYLMRIFFLKGSKPVKIKDNFYIRKYPVKLGNSGKVSYCNDFVAIARSISKGISMLNKVVDISSMRWLK